MTDTHLDATFVALATDGADTYVALAQNGERATPRVEALDPIYHLLRQEVLASIDADRPLVVVIHRTAWRYSTDGEEFLLTFAQSVVDEVLATPPETLPVYVGGVRDEFRNGYYHPRVVLGESHYFARKVSFRNRVEAVLVALTTTDAGLALVPKRRTYVGT